MNEKTVKPFGLKDKIGYMFGDFGNDFTFMFSSTFLMVFYMKVLGISAGAVGTLFLVARFVDAFTDVTMGRIVDTCKPGRDGKFKRWIRIMAGPVALASYLMYQSALADASMTVKMIYMYATYILWGSICYTGINIPYGSMASAITDVPEERTALSTFRSIGATLAQLVIGVGGPMIIYVSVILSATNAPQSVLRSNRTQMRRRFHWQRHFSSLMMSSVNTYLYADYFGNVKALSSYNMITMLCSLLMATITGITVKKFGKRESAAAATVFTGVVFLILGFMNVKNAWLFVVLAAAGYLGVSYFNLIIWANIIDVIDDVEVKTGKREDGTVYAVYSFARKVGQALAGGLGGYALGLIGYVSTAKTQSAEVLSGLYKLATVVPGILFLCVALMLIFVYPLSKKKVEANVEYLRIKREGK